MFPMDDDDGPSSPSSPSLSAVGRMIYKSLWFLWVFIVLLCWAAAVANDFCDDVRDDNINGGLPFAWSSRALNE